ncbi:hypothetical protein K435DRAFT_691469, partial [Dendrothele bispora CBS 962.96]
MGSLCDIVLNELGFSSRLAAFVRFDRNDFNDPRLFVLALAHRLASFDRRLGEAIIDVVQRTPNITETQKLSQQLESLVLGPLNKYRNEMQGEGPIVIVIDGLDECMQNNRDSFSELLQLFTDDHFFAPFPHVRVIIASRPEYAIKKAFIKDQHILHFPLDITSRETQADVKLFLKHKLSAKITNFDNVVSESNLETLARRASGLFIWARVTIDFIAGDPEKRLSDVVAGDPPTNALHALTILYRSALDCIAEDEDTKADLRVTLGVI